MLPALLEHLICSHTPHQVAHNLCIFGTRGCYSLASIVTCTHLAYINTNTHIHIHKIKSIKSSFGEIHMRYVSRFLPEIFLTGSFLLISNMEHDYNDCLIQTGSHSVSFYIEPNIPLWGGCCPFLNLKGSFHYCVIAFHMNKTLE